MQAQNQVSFDEKEGIIFQEYVGDQDYDSIKSLGLKTIEFANKLGEQKRPILILVNTEQLGKYSVSALRAGAEVLRMFPLGKMAVLKSSIIIRNVAGFLTSGLGIADRVNYFDSKEDALIWLKQK